MPKSAHIFAVFAIFVLLAAALQPAIASPVKTLQNSNSTPEPSYVTGATASALASLVQMRDAANQHRRGVGIDVEALINATPGPEINFSKKWGSAGNAPGQFIEPWDAAFDSEGNIYVLDTGNNRIQKFYPNGTFIAQWGSAGAGEGQFNRPRSISLYPGSNNDSDLVYVADTGNHRIQKFYSNGTFVEEWGSEGAGDAQFRNPTGIAADIAGNVFVADTANYRIQKFNSSGTFITKWGSAGTGNGAFNLPGGIAIDSFSIDSTGAVFVADTGNHRIQKFYSNGTFIAQWGSKGAGDAQFELPQGVAIDSSGNVFVADTGNHRIQKFDYNGTFILKWGSEGTGNGTFKSLTGIAVGADGLVYVADTDNNRIQKFSQRDNDADSIPNSVELVLGTDPNNPDSDRDMLNDSYEVRNKSIGTDPLKQDSNDDGLADYIEVTNVSLDVDGDGIPNAWDFDNDGDGVVDGLDSSPFTKSTIHSKFHFHIKTKGNATYIDFQIRPREEEHLKLPVQTWDWPRDDKGQIQNLDNSKGDVQIVPMLELTANQLPAQSRVKDYGIVILKNESKAYIPLSPVQDYGTPVAFQGRMFYPASDEPLNLSVDAKLVWMVNAKTDKYVYQKIVNKHSGKCLDGGPNGDKAYIWDCAAGAEWHKWGLSPVGDGYYKIVNKHSGKCLDVLGFATGDMANVGQYTCYDPPASNQLWKVEPFGDGYYKIVNKHSGKCLDVLEFATGNGANVGQYTCYDPPASNQLWRLEPGPPLVESKPTTIARYKEDFMLTGFSVTENYGSDAGLFYSADDKNQTMRAYTVLRYEFLNSQNPLSAAPAKLVEHNVSVTHEIKSFSHQDAALIAVLNMTRDALKSLPDGKTLPITFAFADTSAAKVMDEFASMSSYILGTDYDIDLRNELEVPHKAIKMPWYNTTTDELLEPAEIIEEVKTWDWSDDEKANIAVLLLAWGSGETSITKIGTHEVPFMPPEKELVLEWIKKEKKILKYLRYGLDIFQRSMLLIGIAGPCFYYIAVFSPAIIRTFKIMFGPLSPLTTLEKWKWAITFLLSYSDKVNTFNPLRRALRALPRTFGKDVRPMGPLVRSTKTFVRVLKVIGIVLIVVSILFIISQFVIIAGMEGWTGFGFAVGAVYAVMQLIYLGIMIAISYIPTVGWIIALVIAIVDTIASIFGYGSQWLMTKVISLCTKLKLRSKVDLKSGETSMNIEDYDDSGLTVGDKIVIKSRLIETISKTGRGKWEDVKESYCVPRFSYSMGGVTYSLFDKWERSERDSSSDWRQVNLDLSVWIKPEKSMRNLPVTTYLSAECVIFYDKCFRVWPFPAICSRKSTLGKTCTNGDTIYFDVLPGNINDFVHWYDISLRDNDGDGLLNEVEKGKGFGSNYYKICAKHSGKCLDVSGSSTADGANVQQWDYTGADNQKWNLEPAGDNYYKICAEHSGKCLDVLGFATEAGANVGQHTCYDPPATNQRWKLDHVGGGYYKICANHSGKCLNVSGNSTADGANVQQWDYVGQDNAKWKFEPVESYTNPNKWDTDADGLCDMFEVYSVVDYKQGTNPLNPDTDADGLNDRLELELGTLPNEKDTDADGLTDFEEHRGWNLTFNYLGDPGKPFSESVWSNPLVNDSDDDGLNDSEEYQKGFNPRSRDTNGDGISDYDEVHGHGKSSSVGEPAGASLFQSSTRDTDGDGLADEIETAGWNITFTNSTGTYTIRVTSEPLLPDTDFDGLNDSEEFNQSSNPRGVDTDGDGLNDLVECELETDITHYDTDGDGLDDSTEITFSSDPKQNDTDGDRLSDYEEFELGSHPNNPDTDDDGLNDSQEKQFNSSLLKPDSDGDLLLDAQEYFMGTDPRNPDTDSDNLTDGYEMFHNTSALNNDTDGDGVLDGEEIELWLNPLCNDTDGDGLSDSKELELGTAPLRNDTDDDGINDSEDPDSYTPQVKQVVLVYNSDWDTYEFVDKLEQYTNVTVVSAEERLLNYSDEPYIVIVGRPDGNETAGNITRDILKLSGDNSTLSEMLGSDYSRFAVEYGVWNNTQTIVMLSHPYHSDHYTVLNILKSMKVTRLPDSIEVEYPSARDFFSVEMTKEVDSSVWVDLEKTVTPWVKMSRYNASTTPSSLSHASGLAEDEEAVGRYLEINVSEGVQNETGDIINWAGVQMYYTASDLDRTGDGDADDVGDIDENTLRVYYFDESANRWVELSGDMGWVFDTGVDTTDDELYGKEYEGFVWANVSHFCLFGVAGEIRTTTPEPTPGYLAGGGAGRRITPTATPTSALEAVVTPTPSPSLSPTPTVAPALTPSPTPVPTPKPWLPIPGFEAIMWLLAMAIAVLILMGYLRRDKRREL